MVRSFDVDDMFQEELEGGAAHHVLVGKSCSVCSQNIFSMFVYTGTRCEICSFIVCIHCSLQVCSVSHVSASNSILQVELTVDSVYDLPVSALTPDVTLCGARQQSNTFSSLSASSLASKMWGRVTKSPSHSICSTCSYVISQVVWWGS